MDNTRRNFISCIGVAGIGSAVALTTKSNGALAALPPSAQQSGPLSLKSFGAKGDGITPDDAAVRAWLDQLLLTGSSGFVPKGTYKMTTPVFLDLQHVKNDGLKIYGEGMHQSIFDLESVNTAPQFYVYGSGGSVENLLSCMYFSMSDIGIKTNCAGPGVQIGRDNFSDAFNMASFKNIFITNSNSDTRAIALKLNHVLATTFTSVNAVCRDTGIGTALSMNQVDFCTFNSCSFGGAQICIHITNGSSYGNVFSAANLEMASYCVVQDSPAAMNNVFTAGGISGWTANAILSSAGGALVFQYSNFNSFPDAGPIKNEDPAKSKSIILHQT